jgi:hypothetical protein
MEIRKKRKKTIFVLFTRSYSKSKLGISGLIGKLFTWKGNLKHSKAKKNNLNGRKLQN